MRTLRVLAILTKRQMADDGSLLVAVFLGTVPFLLALGAVTFIYPAGFTLHVVAVFLVLPLLIGMGSFVLGLAQARSDESRGVPAMLSALSVSPGQVMLARIVTGVAFVFVIVLGLMLAIIAAVMSGLIQWPRSLIPVGLVDLSLALLLIGLACYCLGGLTAQKAPRWTVFLQLWPLPLIVVSLIALKGFGWPLTIALAPFVAASLMHLWISGRFSSLARIGLGFVVVVMVAIPCYWLRFCADVVTALVMLENSSRATLAMYGDFRFRSQIDSHVADPVTVRGNFNSYRFPIGDGRIHFLLRTMGIVNYFQTRQPDGRPTDLSTSGHYLGIYYDEHRGLFLKRSATNVLYAGPAGIAEAPAESLGRFRSPVICRIDRSTPVVFDPPSRCFYAIRFETGDVDLVHHLTDAAFQPVDAITSRVDAGICWVECSGSSVGGRRMPYAADYGKHYGPVVDASGAVGILDVRTWKWFQGAGHLPRPRTFFGHGCSGPSDLFDYDVDVVIKEPEGEYAGLVSASVPRQGVAMTIAVFNKDGRLLREADSRGRLGLVSLFTAKYPVEGLCPPVLALASFFTAYSFEAASTHQALFLMPNSFVALQRDRETRFIFQFLLALPFLLPALLFAGFLSWRVVRDAAVMGLSRPAVWSWGLGTLLFGLPAYITYRLTRPRAALALCRDCGRSRRVDQGVCHQCGSGWNVPVLEPPAWRVMSETKAESSTAP